MFKSILNFLARAVSKILRSLTADTNEAGLLPVAHPVTQLQNVRPTQILPLENSQVRNLQEFHAGEISMREEYIRRKNIEFDLITTTTHFITPGYCYACGGNSTFLIDFLNNDGENYKGKLLPNWRERVHCQQCGLNNRIRGCIHFLEQNLPCKPDSVIYISEQATPLYSYLGTHFSNLTGSEYFGSKIPFGSIDPETGFRNESVTQLTFQDRSLDFILSFDVFEHVPDYRAALQETYRCLKPGGTLLFTVPFNMAAEATQVRAKINADGTIEHLFEPSYHGDPINENGCLCFYIFGWNLLQQLRDIGFQNAQAHLYWSQKFAYFGVRQLLFTATR